MIMGTWRWWLSVGWCREHFNLLTGKLGGHWRGSMVRGSSPCFFSPDASSSSSFFSLLICNKIPPPFFSAWGIYRCSKPTSIPPFLTPKSSPTFPLLLLFLSLSPTLWSCHDQATLCKRRRWAWVIKLRHKHTCSYSFISPPSRSRSP